MRLSGILISDSSQSALINQRIVRTGQRVGNAEVISITENSVVLRAHGIDHVLRVGAEIDTFASAPLVAAASRPHATRAAAIVPAGANSANHHRVVRGETLSAIAAGIANDDVSLHQAMLALFDANPAAFGGSMNLIFAGATLRIPADSELRRTGPAAAVAEVARRLEGPSTAPAVAQRRTHSDGDTIYGPVARGETLSAIVARERPAGVSLNQMMIAVYQANLQSFGDNINVLLQGSTLRIPDLDLSAFAPMEAATRLVSQQNAEWREQRSNAARKPFNETPAVTVTQVQTMQSGP